MFPSRSEGLSNLIADNRLLEQARLLDQEVRLAAQIADPALIDEKTIGDVIGVARRLAAAGCPLRLVDPDEFLDIAQIFSLRVPILADLMQCAVLDGSRHPQFLRYSTNTEFLNYAAELTTSPSPDAATSILGDLLTKLEDKDSLVWKDPVWTARVAAVLAYFSALK